MNILNNYLTLRVDKMSDIKRNISDYHTKKIHFDEI
jgi:hypothetical protein